MSAATPGEGAAAGPYEHLVVELERKDQDRWQNSGPATGGRKVTYSGPADYLDSVSSEGWELVSVTPMHARSSLGGVQTNVVMYTLRRRIDRSG